MPVILSGGAGTRLWPMSREADPKPFIRMADGSSLLQGAFRRAAGLPGVDRVLTVTRSEHLFRSAREYAATGPAGVATAFLLEPSGRGTAGAVACAALLIPEPERGATRLLVLPADHEVGDIEAFSAAVSEAMRLADRGRLVTFGVRPTRAETGFGYLEVEGERVAKFVEKPDAAVAEAFVASGRHLWNAGMFLFPVDVLLDEMARHCPALLASAAACVEAAPRSLDEGLARIDLPAAAFAGMPEGSIDRLLMERSGLVGVVPVDMGWGDVGSWPDLAAHWPSDEHGNRVLGDALLEDARGCIVKTDTRTVAVLGASNLAVIDTPDALLVADVSRSQDVRGIVESLRRRGDATWCMPRCVHRPWGTYTVLEEGAGYKVKRLEVLPGASLSLQVHRHRSEHWIVVSGTASVLNGEEAMILSANQSTYIPAGVRHRLSNGTRDPLVLIEVQAGTYLGEDDIQRLDGGRARA